MMKKSFYFMLKTFRIYLHFCPEFSELSRVFCSIRKLRLISKFVESRIGQQIISIQILYNISRSKGNQTMKYITT